MANHRKKPKGYCEYCGAFEKLTEDHVIPECLFPRGKAPGDAPIVLACAPCNNMKKNLDDSYLRDMLVMDMGVYEHPIAREILDGPVMNAAKQELFNGPLLRAAGSKGYVQSPIAHMVMNHQGRKMSVRSPGGIYVGDVYGISLPPERILRIFSSIVHGLHSVYIGNALPAEAKFRVKREPDIDKATEIVGHVRASGGEYREIGDGRVFQCVFGLVPGRPDMTVWFLAFYQKIVFVVSTENPELPQLETSRLIATSEPIPGTDEM
jgi:hypothetical protein